MRRELEDVLSRHDFNVAKFLYENQKLSQSLMQDLYLLYHYELPPTIASPSLEQAEQWIHNRLKRELTSPY